MATTNYKIVLADGDGESRAHTTQALESENFTVFSTGDSKEAIRLVKEEKPHLVLLEMVLPELDGIDICLELNKQPDRAEQLIVFYTERSEDYSQIAAFNAGADDYIIKPVKPRVLISRIRALLKRQFYSLEQEIKHPGAGLVIDRERYLIFRDGSEIVLPRKEFELLALLSSSPRKVFTRKEISQLIWGYEIFSNNRTIDVHIRKLREKIGEKYIKTIKGVGYSLEA